MHGFVKRARVQASAVDKFNVSERLKSAAAKKRKESKEGATAGSKKSRLSVSADGKGFILNRSQNLDGHGGGKGKQAGKQAASAKVSIVSLVS